MPAVVELRDLDAARLFLIQGLWLQRVRRPTAASAAAALGVALEAASGGQPLLPVGAIGDLAAVVLEADDGPGGRKARIDPAGWPPALARGYDDHALAKFQTDAPLDRAAAAVRRYPAADRPRGVAYLHRQLRARADLGGVELSPAVIRALLKGDLDDALRRGFDAFAEAGPLPLLVDQYGELVRGLRRVGDLLDPADVAAVESRTALAEMREYVAHRQVLVAAGRIGARLPARPVRPLAGRRETPTRVLDEDRYPVGGYTSIGNRGSIESLLHSQLAYMEADDAVRPDLFDLKFVRDELFYYARDENQFLRRRRAFVLAFDPSLADARVKDAALPYQRLVLACAAALASVRRLADWLGADALRFDLLFPPVKGESPLADEAKLFEVLLADLRAAGLAKVLRPGGADGDGGLIEPAGYAAYAEELARTSQVHVLRISTAPEPRESDGPVLCELVVTGPVPTLSDGDGRPVPLGTADADEPFTAWADVTLRLLELWV